MLVLSRRQSESIRIGNNITVTVLAVRGNQVRLGIHAPEDVSIHREEIYYRIKGYVSDSSQPENDFNFDNKTKQEQSV